MTQHEKVLRLLRTHPNGITTNEILVWDFGLASEYRARISELRGEGYVISCEIHRGGASIWKLEAEPPKVEANGQLCLTL